ncbi:hypothetical protein Syun_012809 [Stephania yunnanensis]|uniref:Uncharacterized protein n=1 Tax=Stephania yunnanensis TaxID=152371 RepID=A0AAP0PHX3_9MAGN
MFEICNFSKELLEEETPGLLRLPTNKALLEDPKFCYYVELYAKLKVVKLGTISVLEEIYELTHAYNNAVTCIRFSAALQNNVQGQAEIPILAKVGRSHVLHPSPTTYSTLV